MKTRMVVPVVLALTGSTAVVEAADPPRLLSRGLFSQARPILGRTEPEEKTPARETGSPRFGRIEEPAPASSPTYTALESATSTPVPSPTPATSLTTPLPPGKVKTTEEAAQRVGVTVDELRRLRQLGYLDSEVESLVKKGKRQPRELILEREVLNAMGKEIEAMNARIWQLTKPRKELEEERDRELRSALSRVAKTHRASRDDMRRILAGTSFLNADELKRHLGGPSLFSTDALRRVSLFGGQ